MSHLPKFLLRSVLIAFAPVAANAAGTYYNGNYQSPQTRYTNTNGYVTRTPANSAYQSYQRTGYNTNGYSSYSTARNSAVMQNGRIVQQKQQVQQNNTSGAKEGFWLNGGISREVAQWQFDMKNAGSSLHYDNIDWNVFDATLGYDFNLGNTSMRAVAGFKYGMQSGESTMVDDDITNGGYLVTTWCQSIDSNGNCVGFIGDQIGHALSIGTSKSGDMMGFNFGLGLTDAFKWGNVKFTPSIGYRYLKYKLETSQNYGLAVDTAACFQIDGTNEIQCDPAIIINYSNGEQQIIWRDDISGTMQIASGAATVSTAGTYYYEQDGVSHSYEVEWAGPYVAVDMDYVINQNNAVNGRVELGFPGYTATGDQPYRFDWQHPKSVEDSAGMFGAFHLGLAGNWATALTDTVSLSFGITYDYYNVSDADAATYLNGDYYNDLYNDILNSTEWGGDETAMLDPNTGDPTAISIKQIEIECPGWVCNDEAEIESFYKSLGVRVGLQAKF